MKLGARGSESGKMTRSPEVRPTSEEKEQSRKEGKVQAEKDKDVVSKAKGTEMEMETRVTAVERQLFLADKELQDTWSLTWQHHRMTTWLLRNEAGRSREAASKQLEVGPWPSWMKEKDRNDMMKWMMEQAEMGEWKGEYVISNRLSAERLSHISLITFRNDWSKRKFDGWFWYNFTSKVEAVLLGL